jgi:hypothetical protein
VTRRLLRLRSASGPSPGAAAGDLGWVFPVGAAAALVLGWALTVSIQAACAFVVVVAIVALYLYDRRWGIAALFAFWFLAPGIRRVLYLTTGYVGNDPLSLAPFLATAAVAGVELLRVRVPTRIRRILLLAAAGFAIGLPVGLVHGPRAALYGFIAYLAAVSGAALGLNEGLSLKNSNLRRVLLYALPPIAVYAIVQRMVTLPTWDLAWLDSIDFASVGDPHEGPVRAFGTLNGPGALAPLLGLSLLCYLTIKRARPVVIAGAVLITVALAVTFVRSAWIALIVAGLAHVIASRGRSARVVLGAAGVAVVATLALAPVSPTAKQVVDRFESIDPGGGRKEDTSARERSKTVSTTLPTAIAAPLGHGLGSAGEPSKLSGEDELRAPDNGYLGLMYQVGPIGFICVMAALALVAIAAWNGARARAPGQELRLLLFAMLVYLLVLLYAGDEFYGSHGVILWFIAGQVLAYDHLLRRSRAVST